MEPNFNFKSFGGRPLPITPIDRKLKQSFYKQPVRISENRVYNNIGVHIYDFERHQEDFINYALQYFLCETETPVKLYINRPNHVYVDLSLAVEKSGQQTQSEDALEVAMVGFLLKLREIFVSFFKNQLDWDRIIKENLNDEKLLEEFNEKVIKAANSLYQECMEAHQKSRK